MRDFGHTGPRRASQPLERAAFVCCYVTPARCRRVSTPDIHHLVSYSSLHPSEQDEKLGVYPTRSPCVSRRTLGHRYDACSPKPLKLTSLVDTFEGMIYSTSETVVASTSRRAVLCALSVIMCKKYFLPCNPYGRYHSCRLLHFSAADNHGNVRDTMNQLLASG